MIKVIKESDLLVNENRQIPEFMKNRFYIFCPGCYERAKLRYEKRFWLNSALHCFSTEIHTFNNNMEFPTLSSSLLMTYTEHKTKEKYCCHSDVNNGMIQFLGDCTHPLVNQTVPLMDAQLYLDYLAEKKI